MIDCENMSAAVYYVASYKMYSLADRGGCGRKCIHTKKTGFDKAPSKMDAYSTLAA